MFRGHDPAYQECQTDDVVRQDMRLHAYVAFLSLNLADLVSRSYIKSPSNVREKEICCF